MGVLGRGVGYGAGVGGACKSTHERRANRQPLAPDASINFTPVVVVFVAISESACSISKNLLSCAGLLAVITHVYALVEKGLISFLSLLEIST
jgi:hypothetical protein